MARNYSSSKNITSITYWRKFAQHRFLYLVLAFVFGFGIIAYFGMGPMGGAGNRAAEHQRTEEPIAVVNGEKIERGAYDNQWERFKRYAGGNDLQSVQMQGMVLGGLVDNAIAISAAKKKGLSVSDADIDKQIGEMKKGPDGKPIAEKEFEERLQLQGVTLAALKDDMRQSLLPKVLNESLSNSAKVTEADLLKSYNEVKLRHILISSSKLPEEQAKGKAEKVLAEVKSGKDFATLANQYTDDPGNKQPSMDPKTKKMTPGSPKGGEYDWAPATKYVPEFSSAALALKPGEVSGLVKTSYGFHIIKLEGVRQKLPKDYDKTKAKLLGDFKKLRGSEAVGKFMEEQKKAAKVEWRDPSLEWRFAYYKSNSRATMPGMQSGDFLPKLKAYVDKNPDDSAAAFIVGQQIYQQTAIMPPSSPLRDKLRPDVIKYYELALKHSEDQPTRLTLAKLYRDAKKNDDALRHYKTLARMLKWDDSTESKFTHMQLEKAFKDLGHPELAEKETVRIAQLTVEEKKKADELKKQQEETKKKAEEVKKKADAAKSKPAVAKPGGTLTINPPGKTEGAKTPATTDTTKPEPAKPTDKK